MTKKKYFIFEIPLEIHKRLKAAAALYGLTMRKYIIRAIIEKIARDESYK